MDRPPHFGAGLGIFLFGLVLAGVSLLLYLAFSGILSVQGVPPDDVVALTNLVVLSVGMGLVSTGISLMWDLRAVRT